MVGAAAPGRYWCWIPRRASSSWLVAVPAGNRRTMRNRLLRAPVWVRGAVSGVLFGGVMFVWSQVGPEHASVGAAALTGAVGGVAFGSFMGVAVGRQERTTFRVGGRPLDGDQRQAARRSFVTGQLSEDPLVRAAAVAMARMRLRWARRWAVTAAFVLAMCVVAVWSAVTGQPLWWFGLVAWIGMGTLMLYGLHRDRQRANRLLQAAGDEAVTANQPGQRNTI